MFVISRARPCASLRSSWWSLGIKSKILDTTAARGLQKGIPRIITYQRETSRYYTSTGTIAAAAAMATPYKIQLDLNHKPIFSVPNGPTEESAKKASELLQ